MVTDREILRGIFKLLGSLSEKLTGQIPVLTLETESGAKVGVRASTIEIKWIKREDIEEEAERFASRIRSTTDNGGELSPTSNGTRKEPVQSPVL